MEGETMKLTISDYCGPQEMAYTCFPVTEAGLQEAAEYLDERLAKQFRRSVSDWQVDDPEAALAIEDAIHRRDVAEVERLLATHEVRI
jgi:hypothetical protein